MVVTLFESPIFCYILQQETANSAALGGCYRALHVYQGGEQYQDYAKTLLVLEDNANTSIDIDDNKTSSFALRANPNLDAEKVKIYIYI